MSVESQGKRPSPPPPPSESLLHVVAHEILRPDRGIAVDKLDKRLAPNLRIARGFRLPAEVEQRVNDALNAYVKPAPGTIEANLDLMEAAAFLSADKDYIEALRMRDLSQATSEDYRMIAAILANAPQLLPIDRMKMEVDPEDLQGMMEYFGQGNEAALNAFFEHVKETGGFDTYTDPTRGVPAERRGHRGFRILRDGYRHVWVPDYRGLPEGIDLLNPSPEHRRIVRILRACQFHVSNLNRRGMPNRTMYEFSVRAFPAEGADAPELFALLPEGIHELDEYRKAMLTSTEKEIERVPAPSENAAQAVMSAFHKPIRVVEDLGPLIDRDGNEVKDSKGQTVRNVRESAFMLGAGELFALLEGDRKLEIKRDSDGFTFFRIGNGPEMTMRGMSSEQRMALLKDPTVRVVFANQNDVVFGRRKFGENVATKPNMHNERDGLESLANLLLGQLKKNGVDFARIVRFGEVAVDGQELTIDNPLVRDYILEHPNDPEAGARKLMIELLVSFAQMKNSALALGELTQESWMWDLARKRNLFSPEIADKGLKRHIYDEAYDNNPNYFRPLAQPMGNIWPAWKKSNSDWFTIAEEGNPIDAFMPSLNPVQLDNPAIVIPPIKVNVDGNVIPLHSMGADDPLAIRIKSIHGATRWERSVWRTQFYNIMQHPNILVRNIDKQSRSANPNYQWWIEWAGQQHNQHINDYNRMAIQEIPADQAARLMRTNYLNEENREALSHVDYKEQIELLAGKMSEELPPEEFMGFFGFQRINELDSRQYLLVGWMDHIFKYLKVYPEHWKINADGLARLVPTMNNAIDKRIETLMGLKPEIIKFQADSFMEGLIKQWMETAFVMAGMRDPKESLSFADEFVEAYLKGVQSTMGYTGPGRYENIEDIILYCFQLRDKAVEIASIKILGTGLGVELDDTPLLELDPEKMSVEAMAKMQEALVVGGWNVVFPYMSDPRDYMGELIRKGVLDRSYEIKDSDTEDVVIEKLQAAVRARQALGHKLVKPYVRFGMQIQQKMVMESQENGVDLVEVKKHTVLGNYDLKSNPERLHYLRILNQIEDKMAIPGYVVDSILVRMNSNREEYQEAINMRESALEQKLNELVMQMQRRADELNAAAAGENAA